MRGPPQCAIQRSHQFAREKRNTATRRNSLSRAGILRATSERTTACWFQSALVQQLNCARHQPAVRAALLCSHSHGQTNTTNMKFDQTVLLREKHLDQMSDILRQQYCPCTKKHLGQQTYQISSVQRAQQQHIVTKTTSKPVGSNRSLPGTLLNLRSNLFSDMPCRTRKHVRSFNNSGTMFTRYMGNASAKNPKNITHKEAPTKRVDSALHTARRPIRHNCQSEMKWLRHGVIVARH